MALTRPVKPHTPVRRPDPIVYRTSLLSTLRIDVDTPSKRFLCKKYTTAPAKAKSTQVAIAFMALMAMIIASFISRVAKTSAFCAKKIMEDMS